MKDVAVIIINYNTSKYTLKCIDAVVEYTSPNVSYQIVVVDNNSESSDFNNLEQNFPSKENISLYRSPVNTGFGGGNMFGAQYANAKYLLFLNNDAFLQNDCLSILVDFMIRHPNVGVSTAQNYDKNGKFVPSFDHNKGLRRLIFGRSFLEAQNPKIFPKRKQAYTDPLEVNWVNGAFMFFDAKAFSKVGGFDTTIFLYWEEMDICKRLLDQNYKSVLVPKAKIVHLVGASTGKSKVLNRESYISYLYVIQKNYGWLMSFLVRGYLFTTMLFKSKKRELLSVILSPKITSLSLKHKQ